VTILNVFRHPRRFAACAVLGVSFLAVGPTVLLSGAAQAATVSPAHVSQQADSTPAPSTSSATTPSTTAADLTRTCGCKHHHLTPTPGSTPAGGANTGGGGSLNGGSNVPLAGGGGAAALAAAGIGFFAIKRWRKVRVPSA